MEIRGVKTPFLKYFSGNNFKTKNLHGRERRRLLDSVSNGVQLFSNTHRQATVRG